MKTMMTPMKTAVVAVLAVGLLVGGVDGVVLAEKNDPNPGTTRDLGTPLNYTSPMQIAQPDSVYASQQATLTVTGTITNLDFAHRTLTLNDGESFTLPASLEYAALPMLGQAVEVTFAEQNGQKLVRWIDLDDTAHSHSGS
jgi:Protein of unknown function (DUF1344)